MASTSLKPPAVDEAKERSVQSPSMAGADHSEQLLQGEGSATEVGEVEDNNKLVMDSLVNPPLPAELGEAECAVLRGDAIGSTAYTHRWVLNTLLTITEALPQYLATSDKCMKTDSKKVVESEESNMEHFEQQESSHPNVNAIVELAEDVENAACQLWDMTAEPDVVSYLLNLNVVDVLQLAKDIITLSRAPRLTEVVVGVVANLCCQAEGCEKVVESEILLPSCLAILHTTDDVPTLVEAFRLLKLLLWHATYRVPVEKRCRYPLVTALKSHESMKEALVFMLKNSLSDNLLNAVFEFLEALLYLWLPLDQCYMAAHYSESGLIEGVVEVMRHFMKEWEKGGGQEEPAAVSRGILILYSFVATPAVHTISSFDQYESLLEPILVRYVEHLAKVEKVEELYEEERSEKLVYALGLCELLVPTMRHPGILLHVGKLLALTHGASHHYVAVQNKDLQGSQNKTEERSRNRSGKRHRRHSSAHKRRSSSTEVNHMETDCSVSLDSNVSTSGEQAVKEHCKREKENKEKDCKTKVLGSTVSSDIQKGSVNVTTSIRQESGEKDTKGISSTLKESLADYCVRVVRCCPDLCAVLTTVNECHVHEVELFFQAVRLHEPTLVGQLQEQLLDSGSHNRLVTILSDMYA
ncbi:uncharacterized protein LOC127003947 isoform X2 [Eriocheir sinensis]|uniref:uncharacterized protein LOC127003947 isoform X2 n=1 Tax=Eriocheir sinensis TaxID=95602 RepID=UPI0021C7C79D|nr:uncharacterized protein LOC127003947 isoform X2 [Eriocheir sinensis]